MNMNADVKITSEEKFMTLREEIQNLSEGKTQATNWDYIDKKKEQLYKLQKTIMRQFHCPFFGRLISPDYTNNSAKPEMLRQIKRWKADYNKGEYWDEFDSDEYDDEDVRKTDKEMKEFNKLPDNKIKECVDWIVNYNLKYLEYLREFGINGLSTMYRYQGDYRGFAWWIKQNCKKKK